VDATYATPIHQRPITLGADLVVHSASKYYGGHSDLVAGAVAGSREIVSRITTWRMNGGGCCDPHVAFLIDRGIKTLALRMGAHNRGGQALAEFLEGHSRVRRVNYPGLPSFAHHDRARELLKGMGGMVLFSLDGEDDEADILLSRLRLALPAPSLGGVESLVCQPARTSHAKMSEQERLAVGILPGTIRVSVGIEDPGDLIADFEQALAGSVIE
jgi:cystathionine beta-lyase/cystathionine gamma-synthase